MGRFFKLTLFCEQTIQLFLTILFIELLHSLNLPGYLLFIYVKFILKIIDNLLNSMQPLNLSWIKANTIQVISHFNEFWHFNKETQSVSFLLFFYILFVGNHKNKKTKFLLVTPTIFCSNLLFRTVFGLWFVLFVHLHLLNFFYLFLWLIVFGLFQFFLFYVLSFQLNYIELIATIKLFLLMA